MSNRKDFVIKDGILKEYKGSDREVIIPKGVTRIGDYAFENYKIHENMESVVIPEGVTRIGTYAFGLCKKLERIEFPDSLEGVMPDSFEDSLWLDNQPKGIVCAGPVVIKYTGDKTDIVIPEGIKAIGCPAFSDSSVKSVKLPDSVTIIDAGAFMRCKNLTTINIPERVTFIGHRAFSKCSSLTNITIPDSVTTILDHAFEGCSSLTNITIPDSVTRIPDYLFEGCSNLKKLKIPNTISEIGKNIVDEGVGIEVEDISCIPARYRPNAVLCYVRDGGKSDDPRSENHKKYIKANAAKLLEKAMDEPALLALMCRNRLLTPKNAGLYLEAAEKKGKTLHEYQKS